MRKALSRWWERPRWTPWCGDPLAQVRRILDMFEAGRLRDAYALVLDVMTDPPEWTDFGDVYTSWAELEILVAHNPRKALEVLDEAQRRGCSDMGYYYETRAKALHDAGENELALEYFEKAVAVDPGIDTLVNFGRFLTYISNERARDVWDQVLERDPQNSSAHVCLGILATESGDEETARSCAEKAKTAQLSWPETGILAVLLQRLGEYHAAIREYRKDEQKDFVEKGQLCGGIAECYISLGDARAARKYLERAVGHSPDSDYPKEVSRQFTDTFGVR